MNKDNLNKKNSDSLVEPVCSIRGFEIMSGPLNVFHPKIVTCSEHSLTMECERFIGTGMMIDMRIGPETFVLSSERCEKIADHPVKYRCEAALVDEKKNLQELLSPTSVGKEENQNRILRKPKLLVVDDEEMLRMLIGECFEAEGYETAFAEDGSAGLEYLKHNEVDAVICDIMMPQMSGNELFTATKKIHKQCPHFFFITGYATYGSTDAFEEGAAGHFAKPFDLKSMIKIVNQAISEGMTKKGSDQHPAFYVGRDGLCLVVSRDEEEEPQIFKTAL